MYKWFFGNLFSWFFIVMNIFFWLMIVVVIVLYDFSFFKLLILFNRKLIVWMIIGKILICCRILINIVKKIIGNNIVKKNGVCLLFVRLLNMKLILVFVNFKIVLNLFVIFFININLIFVFSKKYVSINWMISISVIGLYLIFLWFELIRKFSINIISKLIRNIMNFICEFFIFFISYWLYNV